MSHSSARSNDPPSTQPFSATTTGAGIVNSIRVLSWPAWMNSRSDSPFERLPSSFVSRPDENDLPSPRHTMARTSSRSCSSVRISKNRASISSLNALCRSGRFIDTTATDPSNVRRTVSELTT